MIEQQDTISTDDGPMGVYVVRPDGPGPHPVVVSFHHGPGLDDGSKEVYAKRSGARIRVISKPNPKYAKKG